MTARSRFAAAGLILAAAVAAAAASPAGAASHATVKAAAHPTGFFTTDDGQATATSTQSALVRDTSDREHVITTVPSATPDMAHIVYLTRAAKATKWTSHAIPGLRPSDGGIRLEEHLSADNRHVSLVVYQCDGVYVADASVRAVRMPEPTLVQSADNCAIATSVSTEPPVTQSYATYQHELYLLLPDPTQAGAPTVFQGEPGQPFTAETNPVPTTDGFTISQLAYDRWEGGVVGVGEATDGTTKGIYVVKQRYADGDWTAPQLIATLDSDTADYTIESLTTYHRTVWVGLERTFTTGSKTTHRLYLVHGSQSGQWGGVIRLVHDTKKVDDTSLRLLINPETGTLHAAYTRVDLASKVKGSGVMQQALFEGHWSTPKFVSHWYRDTAQQITINSAGKAVVGYQQN